MKPTVTIITPSLNDDSHIKEAIESVSCQNCPNLEYILIDGASTDKSLDIVRKYECNLNYWISEPDDGQSDAINKGLQMSNGNVINWLNSDDYYEKNALQIVVRHFRNNEVKVVCGRSRLFNESGTVKYSNGTDIYPSNIYKTIGWARIDQPETFFRKEAWDKVGLLNEKLHYTMDREWWMRYLYRFGLKGIKQIDDILVNFRLHENSKTVSSSNQFELENHTLFYLLAIASKNKVLQGMIKEWNSIKENIQSDIEKWTDQEIIQKSLNYYLLKRADEFYYQDNLEASKAYLSKIKPDWLEKEDLKLFNSLKVKTRLPLSIIHFFRK